MPLVTGQRRRQAEKGQKGRRHTKGVLDMLEEKTSRLCQIPLKEIKKMRIFSDLCLQRCADMVILTRRARLNRIVDRKLNWTIYIQSK